MKGRCGTCLTAARCLTRAAVGFAGMAPVPEPLRRSPSRRKMPATRPRSWGCPKNWATLWITSMQCCWYLPAIQVPRAPGTNVYEGSPSVAACWADSPCRHRCSGRRRAPASPSTTSPTRFGRLSPSPPQHRPRRSARPALPPAVRRFHCTQPASGLKNPWPRNPRSRQQRRQRLPPQRPRCPLVPWRNPPGHPASVAGCRGLAPPRCRLTKSSTTAMFASGCTRKRAASSR